VLSGKVSMESCIHGFHMFQAVWDPVMGKTLLCHREIGNSEDMYVVAFYKSEEIIGYVLRKISHLCLRVISNFQKQFGIA